MVSFERMILITIIIVMKMQMEMMVWSCGLYGNEYMVLLVIPSAASVSLISWLA